MKVSKLKGRVTTSYVEVPPDEDGGEAEKVEFRYRPGALDLAAVESLDQARLAQDNGAIRALLEPIIVWWDVTDDEGNNLEPKGDDLGQMPLDFLSKIIDKMMEEIVPNAPTPGPSADGSQQMDVSGSAQNGTSSFESPSTSTAPRGTS